MGAKTNDAKVAILTNFPIELVNAMITERLESDNPITARLK